MKMLLLSLCLWSTMANNNPKNLPAFFTKNYALVPAGTLKHQNKDIKIESFYMFKTEISNLQYREFISYTTDKNKYELKPFEVDGMLYDPNNPVFEDYPVRNISYENALNYCHWLRSMLSKSLSMDINSIEVRLPTKYEWMYAGKGGNDQNIYSWNGPYLRNSDGKFLANFDKNINQESITYDINSKSYIVLPSQTKFMYNDPMKVQSHLANDYGIYNMSGNVAEMTQEGNVAMGGSYRSPGYDIRLDAQVDYTGADASIGFRPIVILKE